MTRTEELRKMLDEHQIDADTFIDVWELGLTVEDIPLLEYIMDELTAFEAAHTYDSDEEREACSEERHRLETRWFRGEAYLCAIGDHYGLEAPADW